MQFRTPEETAELLIQQLEAAKLELSALEYLVTQVLRVASVNQDGKIEIRDFVVTGSTWAECAQALGWNGVIRG